MGLIFDSFFDLLKKVKKGLVIDYFFLTIEYCFKSSTTEQRTQSHGDLAIYDFRFVIYDFSLVKGEIRGY